MQDIKKATKGEQGAIQQIFGDEGKNGALMIMRASKQTYENLKNGRNAAGQIGKSLDYKAAEQRKSFNASILSLNSAIEKLAVNKLTPAIQALANAINKLADNPDVFNKLAGGAVGLGALYAGNKGVRSVVGAGKGLAEWAAPEAAAAARTAKAAGRFGALGRFAGGARGAGKLATPLALTLGAVDIGGAVMSGNRQNIAGSIGRTAGGFGGMYAGAALGAGIGTMVMPGVGTAVGGAIGGLAGGFGGSGLGEALAKMVDRSIPEQAKKPKKDDLNLNIRVDAPVPVTVNAFGTGDSNLTSSVSLGRLAAR